MAMGNAIFVSFYDPSPLPHIVRNIPSNLLPGKFLSCNLTVLPHFVDAGSHLKRHARHIFIQSENIDRELFNLPRCIDHGLPIVIRHSLSKEEFQSSSVILFKEEIQSSSVILCQKNKDCH